MSYIKPRTPPGVLELLPHEQVAFQRFLSTIRSGYERFGFLPIETPAFELLDVLLTKSGGDTEKQIYFVQSTGAREQHKDAELALRFDLTVPLARYVAEHEHQLVFPFRRYQMQRVYRGERAQKGRFREFYQCDIDVIGKDTLPLAVDAEIPAVIHHVFQDLDVGDFTILLNNRRLLRGLLAHTGLEGSEKQALVLREIDKLDKVGPEQVRQSLMTAAQLSEAQAASLLDNLAAPGSHDEAFRRLDSLGSTHPDFVAGLADLRVVLESMIALGVASNRIAIDLSIARGLDYYTGTIYETRLDAHRGIGSVCSGGRYDDLAGHYTKSKLPGVGISIGATRLFGQLKDAGLIRGIGTTCQVFVAQIDAALTSDCQRLAASLRSAGLNTELAAEPGNPGKQFKYADRARIPYVVVVGSSEKEKGVATVKHLATTQQHQVPLERLAEWFANQSAPAEA
jgi:histidyl-tRNA synthetase